MTVSADIHATNYGKALLGVTLFFWLPFVFHKAKAQTAPGETTSNIAPKPAAPSILVGVGSSVTVQRGNIDVDRLSKLTEEKLQQVRTRVLRNTLVSFFNNDDVVWEETSPLKNFTSYSFTYQLLETLTSGKSKATLTKQMSGNLAEYAYVYAFARYLNAIKFQKGFNNETYPKVETNLLKEPQRENFISQILPADDKNAKKYIKEIINTQAFSKQGDIYNQQQKQQTQIQKVENKPKGINKANDPLILADEVEINDKTFNFNFTLDYAYAVILSYQKNHPEKVKFMLTRGLDDPSFQKWYQNANLYAYYTKQSNYIEIPLDLAVYNRNQGIINRFPSPTIQNDLITASDAESERALENFMAIAVNTEVAVSYITQIEKSKQLEYITPQQFKAIKYLLREFSDRFRSLSTNNVVAGTLEVLTENLQREPVNPADPEGAGYFYFDAESVIASLYEQFAKLEDRGAFKYIGLVGNIGFNYLHFINSPNILDDNGNKLRDIYLASEKLGIKYKFVNWRYKRAAQAGQTYRYYGNTKTPQHQQKQPLVSDWHASVTGSGILYNIVNTKTDKTFNYGLVQISTGFTFFNNLCLDASIGSPFTNKAFQNRNFFYSVSIDIPLLDYILAGRKPQ